MTIFGSKSVLGELQCDSVRVRDPLHVLIKDTALLRWNPIGLDALEGFLNVFMGVAESDGAAVRAGGGMFGFCQFGEEPVDFWRVRGAD